MYGAEHMKIIGYHTDKRSLLLYQLPAEPDILNRIDRAILLKNPRLIDACLDQLFRHRIRFADILSASLTSRYNHESLFIL